VLVHGITESAASFDPVTERLAAHHDVITLDLRGHGESGNASTYDLVAMAGDVIDGMFAAMMGDQLLASEIDRVNALRRPQHEVVFGVWELILTEPLETIEAVP
jgi:pimeloyl-ACP methyl ester carboxylesterase